MFSIDLLCWFECAIDKFMDGKLAIIKAFYIIVANIIRDTVSLSVSERGH